MELPEVMQARDVQNYLHISSSSAYSIMRRPDFPRLHIGAHRMLVTRRAFLQWIEKSTCKGENDDVKA